MSGATAAHLLGIAYVLLLAGAAVQDVLTLRIPNLWSLMVVAVGAIALALAPGADWWQHLLSFAIVLAIGVLLFSLGWMGGGDAKLMAAAALAFDLTGLIRFVPLVALVGGVLGLISVLAKLLLPKGTVAIRKAGLPYGVAIALGAIGTKLLFPANAVFGG